MAGPPNNEQGHICIRCGGEFVVGLETPGTVNIDYVFLQPGAWGRWGTGGPIRFFFFSVSFSFLGVSFRFFFFLSFFLSFFM